jgi:hypothetical protein
MDSYIHCSACDTKVKETDAKTYHNPKSDIFYPLCADCNSQRKFDETINKLNIQTNNPLGYSSEAKNNSPSGRSSMNEAYSNYCKTCNKRCTERDTIEYYNPKTDRYHKLCKKCESKIYIYYLAKTCISCECCSKLIREGEMYHNSRELPVCDHCFPIYSKTMQVFAPDEKNNVMSEQSENAPAHIHEYNLVGDICFCKTCGDIKELPHRHTFQMYCTIGGPPKLYCTCGDVKVM